MLCLISYLPGPLNASFWVTPLLRKGTSAMTQSLTATLLVLMCPFLKVHPSFLPRHPSPGLSGLLELHLLSLHSFLSRIPLVPASHLLYRFISVGRNLKSPVVILFLQPIRYLHCCPPLVKLQSLLSRLTYQLFIVKVHALALKNLWLYILLINLFPCLIFHHLSRVLHHLFLLIPLPKSHVDALSIPRWKTVMDVEMDALLHRVTWSLVDLPLGKDLVKCRWVYIIKYHSDGSIEWLKARLVAKGYTQTYGVDYFETFSLVARSNSVRLLISLVVNYVGRCFSWTSIMLFYMVIYRKKCIWSNLLGILLRGRIEAECVIYTRLSMDLNSPLEHGLTNLVLLW
ncbi:uncharacterized protein LOC122086370 [Macadamia integrifolia]|uniref:uncharacterized protein LOC122086370 n=1 Tax=Macadamia integrifolia TaxID=60698 RepID=UPI001C4F1927|nr:uncharacterized protein LOC122086370 [Macadamia integrifolia]